MIDQSTDCIDEMMLDELMQLKFASLLLSKQVDTHAHALLMLNQSPVVDGLKFG